MEAPAASMILSAPPGWFATKSVMSNTPSPYVTHTRAPPTQVLCVATSALVYVGRPGRNPGEGGEGGGGGEEAEGGGDGVEGEDADEAAAGATAGPGAVAAVVLTSSAGRWGWPPSVGAPTLDFLLCGESFGAATWLLGGASASAMPRHACTPQTSAPAAAPHARPDHPPPPPPRPLRSGTLALVVMPSGRGLGDETWADGMGVERAAQQCRAAPRVADRMALRPGHGWALCTYTRRAMQPSHELRS